MRLTVKLNSNIIPLQCFCITDTLVGAKATMGKLQLYFVKFHFNSDRLHSNVNPCSNTMRYIAEQYVYMSGIFPGPVAAEATMLDSSASLLSFCRAEITPALTSR